MRIPAIFALSVLLAMPASAQHAAPHLPPVEGPASAQTSLVFDHVLPNVPGKSLKAVLVEYGPGGSSPGHVHPPSAFIYATVLEGAIRSQLNGEPARVYQAGESFFEMPGDQHAVSANASQTDRARLLAVFVVNSEEVVLTRPLPK